MELEAIWNEYHEPVHRFVKRKAPSADDADDIVQDAFAKIYAHRDALRDKSKIKPWIYQIVRNAIADYYRKRRPVEELTADLPLAAETAPPDYAAEVIACFASTIPRLPDRYRAALELSELQGLSQKQVAERLGISYSAAKSRVQRGREMLKELLTGCCHIEADAYGNIVDFRILLTEAPEWHRKPRSSRKGKPALSVCAED